MMLMKKNKYKNQNYFINLNQMLDNNLIFSLVTSLISTLLFYLFTNKSDSNENENKKNELLFLFGIIFMVTFILKIFSQGDSIKISSGESSLSHSSRPPF